MKRAAECDCWTCLYCHEATNNHSKTRCKRCKRGNQKGPKKVRSEDGDISGENSGEWVEAIDPAHNHIYYYNTVTKHSQWERPEGFKSHDDPTLATGWYGRAASSGDRNIGQTYMDNNERYLGRPARQQKTVDELAKEKSHHTEHTGAYNVWYGSYTGESNKKKLSERTAVTTRCVVEEDAGKTLADGVAENERGSRTTSSFCLHFARGTCSQGPSCKYYHRIPMPTDGVHLDLSSDCFGRTRHAEHRDDMEGSGSFLTPSRTLWVFGLPPSSSSLRDELWRQFGEWGEVEDISIDSRRPFCFVRYRLRANAEFAREAMNLRYLGSKSKDTDGDDGGGGVIAVKWAHDDPNAKAQRQAVEADTQAAAMAVYAQGRVEVQQQPQQNDGADVKEEGIDEAKSRLAGVLGI
jgi:hypothetical protein